MKQTVLIVCPDCSTVNRVPETRLAQLPSCGRCHAQLFRGKSVALDADSFERHIARGDIAVLVDFWAPWCAPCLMMAPQFETAAQQLEPAVRFAKVDTEAQPALAARFAIRSIPTLILFREGREIARHSGALAAADIARWVRDVGVS